MTIGNKTAAAHPFLFAVYPVVFLIAQNPEKLSLSEALYPSLLLIACCAAALAVAQLFYRDWLKAGLFVGVSVVLFFGYGSLYALATKWRLPLAYRYLVEWYVVFFVLTAWGIARYRGRLETLTKSLNALAFALVVGNVAYTAWTVHRFRPVEHKRVDDVTTFTKPTATPDIYYFLLDGYSRSDVLRELHEYDNGAFVQGLRSRGFYVSDSSHSNYPYTVASMASTLNFRYLTEFRDEKDAWSQCREMIQHNRAFDILDSLGYDIYTFPVEWNWLRLANTDHYQGNFHLNDVGTFLFKMTPLRHIPWMKRVVIPLKRNVVLRPYRFIQNDTSRSPKLVYVHSACPHPPFLFGPNGEEVNQYDERWWHHEWLNGTGYRDQVAFISQLVLTTVDSILKHSATPPIVIIHSDHGCMAGLHDENVNTESFHEKYSNLCALYFPGKTDAVYAGLTPVNIYPLVFNTYFGAHYTLLPDRSFYFPLSNHPLLTDVTDSIQSQETALTRKALANAK